jgi:hypothetical protein
MAGTESNRDLISRILQESDDDDDDEIDRIIIQNLRKKQAMPEGSYRIILILTFGCFYKQYNLVNLCLLS